MKGDVSFVDRRARELASDPTLNVALEASAGTGKTRVLVDRYIHLIEGGASPRHVLAITFTRKAAGEMRSRIIEELQKRKKLWKDVRTRLFEIHITTIDAFCLGLLREFPLEAGLDPDVALIDEVDIQRLLEESIDRTMAEARRGSKVDLRFLIARFEESTLRRGMRDFLTSRLLKEKILARYVRRVVPKSVSLTASLMRISKSLGSAFRGAEGVEQFLRTGASQAPVMKALGFALRRVIDADKIASADVEEIAGYFLTQDKEPRRRLSKLVPKNSFARTEDYETHRDRVVGLAPLVARAYKAWLREKDLYAIRELFELYDTASKRFAELKAARAGLDFSDVLTYAVALLENRGEFAQSRFRLESRYHHLLIDEFQDTNEVQWRLVRALIESWGEGQGLVQDAILSEQAEGDGTGRIREPSLFIVGDRKQSIYGWRDARVEVLEKASRHLLKIRHGGGQRLTLRTSFRAGGELLSFLNDLFDEVPKVRSDLDWSFQYNEGDHFPVAELAELDSPKRPIALAVATDLPSVASAVAGEIVRVLTEEGRRPKDIAILFRSRSSYRIYQEALVARGVPAYVYRGLGFFDSAEVRDISALVRYLAEPGSELRAAELARSRFIGISDDGLMRVAAGRKASIARWLSGAALDTSLPFTEDDRNAVLRANTCVPRWVALVDRIPPADLLTHILDDADYAAWFEGDEQSWENLKKVLGMVRRAENRGYLTLSRLADYLASASTEEESPAVLDAVDAVNLMTVHAAKGLEFDTVFLVNMHQRTRQDTSLPRIRELPDGRVEISALAAMEPAEDLPNRVEEEEKRLLYVGLTRARRNLVLSTVLGDEVQTDQSFVRLLPKSFRDALTQALDTDTDTDEREIPWGAHRLRVLRPSERPYHEERPERARELRLQSLDASEATAVVGISDEGIGAYRELLEREDVAALSATGSVHYGVPFSIVHGRQIRRGSIGCLIAGRDRVTVLARSARDIEPKLRAAAAAFPGRDVEGWVMREGREPETVRLHEGRTDSQLPLF